MIYSKNKETKNRIFLIYFIILLIIVLIVERFVKYFFIHLPLSQFPLLLSHKAHKPFDLFLCLFYQFGFVTDLFFLPLFVTCSVVTVFVSNKQLVSLFTIWIVRNVNPIRIVIRTKFPNHLIKIQIIFYKDKQI